MSWILYRDNYSDTLYTGPELGGWYEGTWEKYGDSAIIAKSKGFYFHHISNVVPGVPGPRDSFSVDTLLIIKKESENCPYLFRHGVYYKRYDKFTEGTLEILKMKYCEFISSCGDKK